MEESKIELTKDDLSEALKEFGGYIDITEDDLKKLYDIAVKIAREKCIHSWLAREIMSRDVIAVKDDADIHEVGRLLLRHKISGVPVVNDKNHVTGIITEADLLAIAGIPRGHIFNDVVMKYVLNKPAPQHRGGKKVKDIMSTHVITVSPDTTVKKIATILDQKGIKRVPVVDDENKLVGIVSRGDIIRIVCEEESK